MEPKIGEIWRYEDKHGDWYIGEVTKDPFDNSKLNCRVIESNYWRPGDMLYLLWENSDITHTYMKAYNTPLWKTLNGE